MNKYIAKRRGVSYILYEGLKKPDESLYVVADELKLKKTWVKEKVYG